MAIVTPTTRLDAVNVMLSTIGELPINDITGEVPPDASIALNILDEVDLETQSRGWHFNTEEDVTFTPDVDSKIAVPPAIARITILRWKYPSMDVTIRADPADDILRLYDKKNHTFIMPGPIQGNVVYLFEFEKTPQAYRRYVSTRAARIFQDRQVGSQPHHMYNTRDEIDALRFLREHEGFAENRTIFDSMAAARVIAREYPRIWRV